MNPKVDVYLKTSKKWQEELATLRKIILDCGLTEAFKWRSPCYTFKANNVLLIAALKEYAVLSFFKGALLKDAKGILQKPGENTQAARLIRFTSIQEIKELKPFLKTYIQEAIEIEKAGLSVNFKSAAEFTIPEEFQNKLAQAPALKNAFDALTPGRQKAYLLYFSAPKQSKTRESRIEKCIPKILDKKGLNDCTCGLSKKMPSCDGSHKYAQS